MALSVESFGTVADLDALKRDLERIRREMMLEAIEPIYIDVVASAPFNAIKKLSPRKGFRYCQNIEKEEEQYYTEAFELLHYTKGIDFFYTDNATTSDGLTELKDMLELHVKEDIKILKVWEVRKALKNMEEEEQHVE